MKFNKSWLLKVFVLLISFSLLTLMESFIVENLRPFLIGNIFAWISVSLLWAYGEKIDQKRKNF